MFDRSKLNGYCEKCNHDYRSPSGLRAHQKSRKHIRGGSIPLAERKPLYKENAKQARQRIKDAKTHYCVKCDSSFATQKQLLRHYGTKKHNKAL